MATDVNLVPSVVDPEISAALTVFDRLAPLKNALGLADLNDQELQLFAMVAHRTGLDPFSRQIYAVKRKGKVVHQTGIDGYRTIAESKAGGQYAGSDEPTFEDCDCNEAPAGHPKIARVVVHRILPSGHVVDQVGVARWHELYPGPGEEGFMWRRMPFNQLAKCAEANGLRKAFPRVLEGVYVAEEMDQANVSEGVAVPVRPTARERIAARRAAIEGTTEPVHEAEERPETADEVEGEVTAEAEPELCGAASPYGNGETCVLPAGHDRGHKASNRETWSR